MNNVVEAQSQLDIKAIEAALMEGDLARLNANQRLSYYKQVCDSVGLNPLTKPFDYLRLNNKIVLYAGKNCAEQLRKIHKISIFKIEKETDADTYTIVAYAKMPDGREDASTAVIPIAGLKGEALANAKMKCETKAKRRVTLSIVSLGMLDETEVVTIPDAQRVHPEEVAETHVEEAPCPPEITKAMEDIETNPGEFVIRFTKGFKGKMIKELDLFDLKELLSWCEKKNFAPDFQMAAIHYIGSKTELPQASPEPNFDEPIPDFDVPNEKSVNLKPTIPSNDFFKEKAHTEIVEHKHIFTASKIEPGVEKCMIKLANGEMCKGKRSIGDTASK